VLSEAAAAVGEEPHRLQERVREQRLYAFISTGHCSPSHAHGDVIAHHLDGDHGKRLALRG
jgi:hypothetical protein